MMKYTLNDFNNITFDGFNFIIPEETIKIISELALEVGSPTYMKTPIFQKKENPMKIESTDMNKNNSLGYKKRRGNKNIEVFNEEDWELMRNFQPTKMEDKTGIDIQIDLIRGFLNKMTDKNYTDNKNKIINIINDLISENILHEDMIKVSTTIFEIASTNRYYSKIYADLYSELINNYDIMRMVFEESLNKFTLLFDSIEYIDPTEDYDKFCKINKDNEKRKALSTFFMNLMTNKIISEEKIIFITRNLLFQIYTFISQENKKNEVDELTENIFLLYKNNLYKDVEYELIDNMTIQEVVEKLAHSKPKDYKSFTNKSIFKFMDMIDM